MATVWRIRKWAETFERAESRKLKVLTWVAMPVAFTGSGYNAMLDEFGDDAPAIYGAWAALCGFAAQCHIRGTLGDGRGNPLTIRHIARVTGFPPAIFDRLFAWAQRPEIGWLEPVSVAEVLEHLEQTQQKSRDLAISGESPDDPPMPPQNPPSTQPNQTQPNITGQDIVRRSGVWGECGSGAFFDLVVETANLMHGMKGRGQLTGLDRDTVWRMAWIACDTDRPSLLDALARIREGDVKKPANYLASVLRKLCEREGGQWDRLKHLVPPPPPPRMPPAALPVATAGPTVATTAEVVDRTNHERTPDDQTHETETGCQPAA